MEKRAYPTISTEEFDRRLFDKLEDMTAAELVREIGTIYCEASEYFNNEILDDYDEDNGDYLNYDQVLEQFLDGMTIEEKRKEYGYDDIALREDFNNYTDMLCKDDQITEWAYNNWDNPF